MKKVWAVFLGLILLSLAVKFWERGREAASVKRQVPAVIHHAPSDRARVFIT